MRSDVEGFLRRHEEEELAVVWRDRQVQVRAADGRADALALGHKQSKVTVITYRPVTKPHVVTVGKM